MAVDVDVNRAVVMAVRVDMHAVAPQPPQQMRAETDKHDTDRGLQRPGELFGDGVPEQDRRTGKGKQRQRVPEPPGQPVLDDVSDLAASRCDRGHRGDVVGLQRMLHAQQEAKTQDCEHASPAFLGPRLAVWRRRTRTHKSGANRSLIMKAFAIKETVSADVAQR